MFYEKIAGENTVVEVVDGDTFQLKSGRRVRLMGVDAPEYNRCGGIEAKNRLSYLILNKKISLQEEVQEAFGRTLALTYIDNTLVNEIILQEGWGVPDYRKNSQRDRLTSAYHTAQQNKAGVFGLCRDVEKGENPACAIKGNIDAATSQKFYHLVGCRYYEETKIDTDRGEKYFCTEKDAESAGFTRASSCP